MATILMGAPVADALNANLSERVAALNAKGVTPTLAILRVGERPDDIAYEKGAMKRCEKVGLAVRNVLLGADTTQETLIARIRDLNSDPAVHGVLMFRPLPGHLDEPAACEALSPSKDVDGITQGSLAGVFSGTNIGYPPCTPQACMEILDYYGIDVKGARAAVIGRSLVVGKPAAMMLLSRHATVTICHTRTMDMPSVVREAKVVIAAAGKAGVVGPGYFAPGQIVLDVGINMGADGKLTGDVDFACAQPIVEAITPVPGGVGTVTTSVLVKHTVEAAERSQAAP
ncbi:MAG: bifunctional 5,10-methylenetetrahydrofolate dehydrogenase/5,10-methenyltetrahydrofolate cyclohydrolase [Lachnospiraceae bacterium]|nr:bifunctional 5,10-methylenetetrahydrofolate dehydrogenase/5,10-methenyltetrahydrofolate cyclohydrolase [Lachnospiraceae bacterium]